MYNVSLNKVAEKRLNALKADGLVDNGPVLSGT